MKQLIDLATWERREYYEFFSAYDEPFFGVQTEVECAHAQAQARELGVSFFLYYTYCSLAAINAVPELRCRVVDGQVLRYDVVHDAPAIGRPDHSFGFAVLEMRPTLAEFIAAAQPELEAVQASTGLRLIENNNRPDTVHSSTLPWMRFTGLSHARRFSKLDTLPKLSYGQVHAHSASRFLPVSLHVHHGLADGYHVGQYLHGFQEMLNRSDLGEEGVSRRRVEGKKQNVMLSLSKHLYRSVATPHSTKR